MFSEETLRPWTVWWAVSQWYPLLVFCKEYSNIHFPSLFTFPNTSSGVHTFCCLRAKNSTRSLAKQRVSSRLGIQVPVRQWGLSAQGKFYICLFRHKQVADRVISIGTKGNRRYIISITKNHNILFTFPNSFNMNCKRKLCSCLNEARHLVSHFFSDVCWYTTPNNALCCCGILGDLAGCFWVLCKMENLKEPRTNMQLGQWTSLWDCIGGLGQKDISTLGGTILYLRQDNWRKRT